jgi:hypothetical protein
MAYKNCSGIIALTALLFVSGLQPLQAQNIYPASGDALIHGLTIGTGAGGQISNTALGDSALFHNTSGFNNTAVGMRALFQNSGGAHNAALGYQTLYSNTTASFNLAAGSGALHNNQLGYQNVALGDMALYNNIGDMNGDGSFNVGVGSYALYVGTYSYQNVAFGYDAMFNSAGYNYSNTAFGLGALQTNTTGVYNTALGAAADVVSSNLSNTVAIGYGAVATAYASIVLGNSSVTSIGGYAGWTTFSDGRYKKNVNRNVPGLAFINKLDPVTYTLDVDGIEARLHAPKNRPGPDGRQSPDPMDNPYIRQAMQEKSRIVHTGFIAQEVEKAAQSLGYTFSGVDKPKDDQQSFYGLRYSDFVAPLVKAVQELSAENDSLKAINDRLKARLDRIKHLLGIDSNARNSDAFVPGSARLFQNQPNPISQATIINYYVSKNCGAVSLQITGMNGEIIKTIVIRGYGYGQVDVQTTDLEAGTYTYSLFVDGKLTDTRKMTVVK